MRYHALLLPVALTACTAATAESGVAESRNFAVSGRFDAVSLDGPDNVEVVPGDRVAVVATGPANQLNRLNIRVEGSTLRIGRKRDGAMGWLNWSRNAGEVRVRVTAPPLRAASLAGSGRLNVSGLRGNTVNLSLGGSGALTADNVRAGSARLSVTGSGDLAASGQTNQLDASIAGSGDIRAAALASRSASVSIAGSGDMTGRATDQAEISIMGSGDVVITGTSNCRISKMGSGEARCG